MRKQGDDEDVESQQKSNESIQENVDKMRQTQKSIAQAANPERVSARIGTKPPKHVDGQDVALASADFKHSTSQAFDWVHVCHWKHMGKGT